jgi:hypothetical protein
MTETEWSRATNPERMLAFLRGRVSERKLRLFACACCRRIWRLLTDPRARQAVEVSEGFADGLATPEQLSVAYRAVKTVVEQAQQAHSQAVSLAASHTAAVRVAAHRAAQRAARRNKASGAGAMALSALLMADIPTIATEMDRPYTPADGERLLQEIHSAEHQAQAQRYLEREQSVQCLLLRCIAGHPFRPVALDSALRTSTLLSLAWAAYNERLLPSGELDLQRLAVLADAFEEAGCTDPRLLDHLRGPGPHVRGCHVVDALLGRE